MEKLRDLLSDPSSLTTKVLSQFETYFVEGLKEDEEGVMNLFADLLFSNTSKNVTLAFITRAKKILDKQNLSTRFLSKMNEDLDKNYWNSEIPNYSASINAIAMFGNEIFFKNSEIKFVEHFVQHLNNIPADSELNAFKLTEFFFAFSAEPIEMTGKSDVLFEKSTTYSYLIVNVLQHMQKIVAFDAIFTFLRCAAAGFNKIFDSEIIETLFTEKDSNLKQFIVKNLPHHMVVLLVSIIARTNQKATDLTYSQSKSIILHSHDIVERVFALTALSQIIKFVATNDDFLNLLIDSMFRDIDSTNHLLSSTVKSMLNSLFKTNKKDLPTVCAKLMKRIEHLDWSAKLKAFLLPQLLPHLNTTDFDPTQLISIAQNLADATFVTKCIRSYATNEESCQNILNSTVNYMKSCSVDRDLPSLRPLFEPLLDVNPKFIKIAFDTFKKVEEKFAKAWLIFEASRSMVKSKWILEQNELFELIKFGLQSLNWDLRASAFEIYMLSGYPQTEEESNLLFDNLENLLFVDSPKHTSSISSTMKSLIDGFGAGKTRYKIDEIIKPLLTKILDVFDNHMIPSYITHHKQFVLEINSAIISNFPELENEKHLLSLASMLFDNAITKQVSDIIKSRMAKSEQISNFFTNLKNEKVQKILFATTEVIGNENLKVREGLPASELEFKQSVSSIESLSTWEEQAEVFRKLNESLQVLKHVMSQECINECIHSVFEALVKTRKLGVACSGQMVLENLMRLVPEKQLNEICDNFTSRIISTLSGFDMENMRRSAALPLLAMTIIRLQATDVMKVNNQSNFMTLIQALLNLIKTTENATEATNALNVVRGILLDKATSVHSDSIVPFVLDAILVVLRKIGGWEVVAAGNLCLSAVIRKLTRIGSQSSKYLTLEQFLAKTAKVRDSLILSLKSNKHSVYVALTVLTHFEASSTDEELQSLALSHLGDRDCRLRRAAARAAYMCTAKIDRVELFNEIVEALKRKPSKFAIISYNYLHGLFDLMHEIVNDDGFAFDGEFPQIDFRKVPPFIWSDIIYVYSKLNLTIPEFDCKETVFAFDESSLAMYSKSSQTFSQRMMTAVALKNQRSPQDYPKKVLDLILSNEACPAVENTCLSFSVDKLHEVENVDKLISMIINEDRPGVLADLISVLKIARNLPNSIMNLADKFLAVSFTLSEAMTPVHIAISKMIGRVIDLSPKFAVCALRLSIDEIPAVRVPASKALAKFAGCECEIAEVSAFRKSLAKIDRKVLIDSCMKWASLVDAKRGYDTHGEPLTVLVDEFFYPREICNFLGISVDFDYRPIEALIDIRENFKNALISALSNQQ